MGKQYQITCTCGKRMSIEPEQSGTEATCSECGRQISVSRAMVDTRLSPGPQCVSPQPVGGDGVPVDWKVGDVYLDLYEVLALLGQGGMGKVFRVHHRRWEIDLAVKCPKPEIVSKERGLRHFERECEMWVNLGLHPHIVSCYYIRQLGGIPRVFAEYVPGVSLQKWIRRKLLYRGGPDKALELLLLIAVQIAWGLEHAHGRGVVHQDVKPANVMLCLDGQRGLVAKVTDFGLAKVRALADDGAWASESAPVPAPTDHGPTQEPSVQTTHVTRGGMTPAYCSPEQAFGGCVGPMTDVWSWALCLLEALIGKVVWRNGTQAPAILETLIKKGPPEPHLPRIPKSLAELLRSCFREEPSTRPDSMLKAAAVVQDIYREVTGRPFPLRPPGPVEGRAESLNNRAVSFLDLGKRTEAERLLGEALMVTPQHPESTFNLEVLRWRLGRTTDQAVVQRLRDVAALHPKESLPIHLLAQVHIERGDCESAISLLEGWQGASVAQHDGGADSAGRRDVTAALSVARDRLERSFRLLRKLNGHMDSVRCVCASRNGRYALSGSEDNTLRLWEVETGQCVRTFVGHGGSVESVYLAQDGRYALSGSRDRTVRLWDVVRAQCLNTLEGHGAVVQAVVLARDMAHAVSADQDGRIIVWSLGAGKLVSMIEAHRQGINALGIRRDGQFILSAGEDATLKFWDLRSKSLIRTIQGPEGPVKCAWLTSCGQYALAGGVDNVVRMWAVQDGACIRTLVGHTDCVNSVSLSRDARYIVSGSRDKTVRIWEMGSGRCLRTLEGHQASVNAAAITRDSRHIVSGSRDNSLNVWGVGTPDWSAPLALCRALRSESAASTAQAFRDCLAQAQEALAIGSAGEGANARSTGLVDPLKAARYVREARSLPGYERDATAMDLWRKLYVLLPRKSLTAGWEAATFEGHADSVESVCLSSDGRLALSGGADGTVRLWDIAQSMRVGRGHCVRTFAGHGKRVSSVSFTGDGRYVLSGSSDTTVRVWDLTTGELATTFDETGGPVETLCISPDGRYAMTGGLDLRTWEVATGRCLRTMEAHSADVAAVAWSPEGRFILSGSTEGPVKLWDIASGQCVRTFTGHTGTVQSLQFSADTRFILSASGNIWGRPGEIKLWAVATGQCVRTLTGHAKSVNSVCLSEGGRFAVSGSSDTTLRVWDLSAGQCVRTFKGHEDAVQAVTLSREGRLALTAGADGLVKLWVLDWDIEEKQVSPWDEGARPYLDSFLTLHMPYGGNLPKDRAPTQHEVARALCRRGEPTWTEKDLRDLLYTLGCAGYGWLAPEGIRNELERMAEKRAGGTISGFLDRIR